MEWFIVDLGCTAFLAGLYLWGMRRQSPIGKLMGLSVFLTAGCFLDRLCGLVMEGIAQEAARNGARLAGLALSKSMAGIFLLLLCGMCRENVGAARSGMAESVEGGAPEADGPMRYMEKLTVAGTVFFWCLLIVTGLFFDGKMWIRPGSRFGRDSILLADFIWTLLLFAALMGFWLSVYLYLRAERGRQEERNRQEERRQTISYLHTIENNYQRTRELWHDLRNHISLLNLLLREEKYGQMRDYLKVFGEEADRVALPAKSGNLIVDAVLADKAAKAKRENINVDMELCDLTMLPLKPDEICSLFGNLLDNAIEACIRAQGEKRILVTCRMRGEDIYFSVRNTLAEGETTQGNGLLSHKKDRENVVGHGLGLRSVERVVNRYAGEVVTGVEDGMFTAAVWLGLVKK